VQRLAAEAGRRPFPIWLFGVQPDPEQVAGYRAAGADHCVFRVPPVGADEALPFLARCAEVMRSVA
jgi:hypothetical protein